MNLESILLAKRGNERAKLDVIESFMGLIVKKSNLAMTELTNIGYSLEDFIQLGKVAVLQGINSINEEQVVTAPAYIIKCINSAYLLQKRKDDKSSSIVSLFEEVKDDLTLADMISSDYSLESDYITKRYMEKIKVFISSLEEEDQELFFTYVNNTYGGLKEFCDKYSLNYRQVRYKKDILMKNLRNYLC